MDVSTPRPTRASLFFAIGLALVMALPAEARDERREMPRELAVLAERIAGGAAIAADVERSRDLDEFREVAERFEEGTSRRRWSRGPVEDWRQVRDAWNGARRRLQGRDPRSAFLLTHLDMDIAATDRLMASAGGWQNDGGDTGSSGGSSGKLALVEKETCVGTQQTDHSCPSRRSQTLTFRLPRDVTAIKRFDAEWRDYGRPAEAQLYVNDRMVWKTDVNKDWDGDGTGLDVRVPAGSTITVRSSTGDPIWIRKLSVDVVRGDDGGRYRDPWDF